MPGSIWFSFRQGNRSEYLALYILSALGISVKVPREEDIGADFHCSLAEVNEGRVTFYAPFLVQIKSMSNKNIIYGGVDRNNRWKKEEVDWLFGQELPLFIGLVDKEKLLLNLYSTSNMWAARYTGGNVGQVVLKPDDPTGQDQDIPMPTSNTVSEWYQNVGDGKRWEVPLGPPLVSVSIDDLEDAEKMKLYRKILLYPLYLEQGNITYRRLCVHYSKWPLRISTNKLNNQFPYGVFCAANPAPGANTKEQIQALAPIIVVLAYNYKLQGNNPEIEKLKCIVHLIPEGVELNLIRNCVPELFS